ncbi:MAG: PIG-L family deacetylase [Chloroflexi bacterium]|nr:PIG-L family deacetylase [Chloroflexota bacterium]
MRKLLAIFAHPDDEGVISGTLAYYARHETEVRLVCTTKGEAGEISDPALATPETLGDVRAAELRAACEVLGVLEPHFLGYRDSGMADTPANEDPRALVQASPAAVVGQLVALMRQLKPDVVITFEPFGWYGHPDHQVTGRLATAAFDALGDALAYPDAGPPWQPQRLFHAVLPASNFHTIRAYAEANDIEVGFGEQFPMDKLEEAEAQVTHVLDIRHLLELKQTAIWSHRTQFKEDHLLRKLPEELIQQTWGYEYFIQVYPTPPNPLKPHRAADLFVAD